MQKTDRMQKLEGMLEANPGDAFLLFAMGMEHKKVGNTEEAIRWFNKTLEKDPGYCVAYHQTALTHEDAGNIESAKVAYREGIEVARKKGDHHAAEEMEAALALIESS
jgi:tetratricopeptide (TPR) repeat protein